jgi:hypothetical protein
MTNKRKKLARDLSEKTGMSYQAAINVLAPRSQPSATVHGERSVRQLLSALKTTTTFGVVTGRTPATGRSATLSSAIAEAEALASEAIYYAESTHTSAIVTLAESSRLLRAGAVEHGSVQMIRAFAIDGHTISEQCESCRAWISCFQLADETAATGTCHCGRPYRIVFDGEPDWDRVNEELCMQCGTEHGMSQRHENLNPWRHVNDRQVLCNRCASGAAEHDENELLVLKDEFERQNGHWIRRRLTKHRRTGFLRQTVRLATTAEVREAELE